MKKGEVFSIISYVLAALLIVPFLISTIALSIQDIVLAMIVYIVIFGIGFFICFVFSVVALIESGTNCRKGFKIANVVQTIIYSIIMHILLWLFLVIPILLNIMPFIFK